MQIGRIEIGIWRRGPDAPSLTLKDYFLLEYTKGICGCKIFTFSKFYLTILSEDCMKNFEI